MRSHPASIVVPMARWTVEQALRLAPDEPSRRAAKALIRPELWTGLGANETLVWGACQGSSREPYQVSVELEAETVTCSCPSRKYPCKHGVALLVLWASGRGDLTRLDRVPDFVEARLAASPHTPTTSAPDPVALEARVAARLATMDSGLDLLDDWLADVVRNGLAEARARPPRWWDDTAARLVDAQMPTIADRIRSLSSTVHARGDWPDVLVGELGRLALVSSAWRRRDDLDPDAWADVRTQLGWAWQAHELADRAPVTGTWSVVGVVEDEDGRVRSQRTWLRGDDGEFAVIFDFAAAGAQFGVGHVVGSSLEATVVVYPGSTLPRVRLAGEPVATPDAGTLGPAAPVVGLRDTVREQLARSPFVEHVPAVVGPVELACDDGEWWLTDATGSIPIDPAAVHDALAATGGDPFTTFGEWSDGAFSPRSLVGVDGILVST